MIKINGTSPDELVKVKRNALGRRELITKTSYMQAKVFFWVFLILGITALVGAIFFNAPHQYFTACLCGIAAFGQAREFKKFKQSKTK